MLSDKQYAEKVKLERSNMLGTLSAVEQQRYYDLLTQERAPQPVEPMKGHKCLGARRAVEVACECGWVSLPFSGEGARSEAYADWRAHVRDKHKKADAFADRGAMA